MSYILDALRKSDQQRQRGTAPTLLTSQATTPAPKRPAFSVNALLAAVLVGAGILIGWLRPWQQPEPPAPATESIAATPAPSNPHLAAPMPLPAIPDTVGESAPAAPAREPGSAASRDPASDGTPLAHDRPVPVRSEPQPAPPEAAAGIPKAAAPMPDKSAGASAADGEHGPGVMAQTDLPPSIQNEIPAMSISFHAYTGNAKDRRVMINNEMVREGDTPAPGLLLEQITRDGVIMRYKEYRFSRRVQ